MSTTQKVGKRALLAQARRDDARAEEIAKRGHSAKSYSSEAPNDAFHAHVMGLRGNVMRNGTTARVGGALKFVPKRDTVSKPRQPAESHGGNVGDALKGPTPGFGPQEALVNREASLPRNTWFHAQPCACCSKAKPAKGKRRAK